MAVRFTSMRATCNFLGTNDTSSQAPLRELNRVCSTKQISWRHALFLVGTSYGYLLPQFLPLSEHCSVNTVRVCWQCALHTVQCTLCNLCVPHLINTEMSMEMFTKSINVDVNYEALRNHLKIGTEQVISESAEPLDWKGQRSRTVRNINPWTLVLRKLFMRHKKNYIVVHKLCEVCGS